MEEINVCVVGIEPMNSLVAVTTTKSGFANSRVIECGYQYCCFKMKVIESLLPQFTLTAFYIKNNFVVHKGSAKIINDDLNINDVSFSVLNFSFHAMSSLCFVDFWL